MDQTKLLKRKNKLDNLIAAYSEIWADVLLDKNLNQHYLQIEDDLLFLDQFIKLKDAQHQDTTMLCMIAHQLIQLREIVAVKLNPLINKNQ
jgi:hypothetical protein